MACFSGCKVPETRVALQSVKFEAPISQCRMDEFEFCGVIRQEEVLHHSMAEISKRNGQKAAVVNQVWIRRVQRIGLFLFPVDCYRVLSCAVQNPHKQP